MDKSISDFNVRLRTIKLRELIIGLVIALVITGIVSILFPEVYDNDDLFLLIFSLSIILFFIYALIGSKGLKNNFRNLFKDDVKKEILYVFIINFLFAFLTIMLISALDYIIALNDPSWISIWDIDSVDVDSGINFLDIILSLFYAPIFEELIFRGIIFNRLKIRIGIIPAMLISSFVFGIGHSFVGIISAFIFGICMCILYLKTDNILVPISVHFLNNFTAVILDGFGFDYIVSQMPWIIPFLIIVVIGSVLLIKYVFEETVLLKRQYS